MDDGGNGSIAFEAMPSFGGTVATVTASPRIAPAPATLEEARTQPGRRERIEALTQRIESEGIKYVFFQQISVTGRIMGKGVVSSFFPQVAERGYQLVYGATANLFTDRYGNYIGFGPEESELAAVADLDTFRVLPWDKRVARVFCTCFRNREERTDPAAHLTRRRQVGSRHDLEGGRASWSVRRSAPAVGGSPLRRSPRADRPALAPKTRHSDSELEPSLFAPLMLTHAASPAAKRPGSGVAPSTSVCTPPIM